MAPLDTFLMVQGQLPLLGSAAVIVAVLRVERCKWTSRTCANPGVSISTPGGPLVSEVSAM